MRVKLNEATGEIILDLAHYLESMEMDDLAKMKPAWRSLAMQTIRNMLEDTTAEQILNSPLYELRKYLLQDEEIVGDLAAKTVDVMVSELERLHRQLYDMRKILKDINAKYRDATGEYLDIQRDSHYHVLPENENAANLLYNIIDGSLSKFATMRANICPYCGSNKGEQVDRNWVDGTVEETMKCLNCDSEYLQIYYLGIVDKFKEGFPE